MKLFLTRSESAALRRCISMLEVSRSGFALSLLLGVTALSAAIALGGTAAWLIARASQQPPVLYLTVDRHLGSSLWCLACTRTLPVAPRFPQGGADGHG